MPYEYENSPLELRRNFNRYAFAADTPPELADRLQQIPGVDADVFSEGGEILFAHYDLLSDAGKILLAQLTAYGVQHGWAALNRDGRWEKIRDRARKDVGDDVEALPDADMPEPQTTRRDGGIDWRNPPAPAGGD